MALRKLSGVFAPAITPFRADLSPDTDRYLRHARWLLANGCAGLAAFGTNSEANSLDAGERMNLLEHLVANGVSAEKLMPGTGCCALPDSVRLTRHAVSLGCSGVLMLPPFYYKGVSDDGLFRSYSEVIERVGDARLQVYLYHIPQVSQVPISLGLIERLLKRYPETVAGIKDSAGDWNNTQALLTAFASTGFEIFAGSESFLLPTLRGGGVGCISATANVNPAAIHDLFANWQEPNADQLQADVSATRLMLQKYQPLIAVWKAIVAEYSNDPEWARLRPPLDGLSAANRDELVKTLRAAGFTMPGLTSAVEVGA